MDKPLLTLEELSRLIDNELSDKDKAVIERKLANCSTSEQLLNRLRELTEEVAHSILTAEYDFITDTSPECLSEDEIIDIIEHKADETTLQRIEKHLAGCRRCLLMTMQHIRTSVSMNANNWQELPEHIRKDPRLKVVSKIRRPAHCVETTNEIIGELQLNLINDPVSITREFGKWQYAAELTLSRKGQDVANLGILYTFNRKPRQQIEFILTDQSQGKSIFRGLTGTNGKILIRRLQPNKYLLGIKEIDAVIEITVSDNVE